MSLFDFNFVDNFRNVVVDDRFRAAVPVLIAIAAIIDFFANKYDDNALKLFSFKFLYFDAATTTFATTTIAEERKYSGAYYYYLDMEGMLVKYSVIV